MWLEFGGAQSVGQGGWAGEGEDEDGLTPLCRSCYELRVEEVRMWLKQGHSPTQVTSFAGGCTPVLLVFAGYENSSQRREVGVVGRAAQILEALLASGAKLVLPASVVLPSRSLLDLAACAGEQGLERLKLEVLSM